MGTAKGDAAVTDRGLSRVGDLFLIPTGRYYTEPHRAGFCVTQTLVASWSSTRSQMLAPSTLWVDDVWLISSGCDKHVDVTSGGGCRCLFGPAVRLHHGARVALFGRVDARRSRMKLICRKSVLLIQDCDETSMAMRDSRDVAAQLRRC